MRKPDGEARREPFCEIVPEREEVPSLSWSEDDAPLVSVPVRLCPRGRCTGVAVSLSLPASVLSLVRVSLYDPLERRRVLDRRRSRMPRLMDLCRRVS